MASNPCYVTQGFREDCARLISRFDQLETVRYDGFCEIWQDMKFSLVFSGRNSFIELLEFCEDSLTIAKEFFLPPLTFQERIGGLYLLYGLYFKMPVQGPKIRVKLTEWKDIMDLRAEIGQAEHHDASFILSKLMSANAFIHTFLDQELGLEKNYRLKAGREVNPYSLLPEIRELAVPNDLFDRINILSKHYELTKSSETSTPSTSNTTSNSHHELQLYDSNFGQELLNSVKQLENSRKVSSKNAQVFNPMISRNTVKYNNSDGKNEQTRKGKVGGGGGGVAIRSITGHGFDTDSSPSEDEQPAIPSGNSGALPDFFDESSLSE